MTDRPLPASGGSYTRDDKGRTVLKEVPTAPARRVQAPKTAPATAPARPKPQSKEA